MILMKYDFFSTIVRTGQYADVTKTFQLMENWGILTTASGDLGDHDGD